MIYVDSRAGSDRLPPVLRACGLPVQVGTLTYGDIRFVGIGPDGPVNVGVEYKTLHDVLHCITDGRFAGHQLPGMMQNYDQAWLLIEGAYRQTDNGTLQYADKHWRWRDAHVGSRGFMYRDFMSWLFTMQIKAGLRVAVTQDERHTATWIRTLYSWWTDDNGWENHKSHLALNNSSNNEFWARVKMEERANGRGKGRAVSLTDRAMLIRPTTIRMVASQLPGVGYKRSEQVAKSFRTVEELVAADERMLGKALGKETGRKVWKSLRGIR